MKIKKGVVLLLFIVIICVILLVLPCKNGDCWSNSQMASFICTLFCDDPPLCLLIGCFTCLLAVVGRSSAQMVSPVCRVYKVCLTLHSISFAVSRLVTGSQVSTCHVELSWFSSCMRHLHTSLTLHTWLTYIYSHTYFLVYFDLTSVYDLIDLIYIYLSYQ